MASKVARMQLEGCGFRDCQIATAIAGSIASAIRFLTKAILEENADLWQICRTSSKGIEILGGQLASVSRSTFSFA